MLRNLFPVLVLSLTLPTTPLWANQGAAPMIVGPQASPQRSMPARGSTMEQVKKTYGNPLQIIGPSGETTKSRPPITRWVYKDYIVYFENNRVIHSAKPRSLEIIKFLNGPLLPPVQSTKTPD